MQFPRLLVVRQKFPDRKIADVAGTVRAQLAASSFKARLKPGSRVAIAVGSRGMLRYEGRFEQRRLCYYDYAIADDKPAAEGQLAVRLVATARDVLESVTGRLTAAGIEADVVGTTEDPIDRPSSVPFGRAGARCDPSPGRHSLLLYRK